MPPSKAKPARRSQAVPLEKTDMRVLLAVDGSAYTQRTLDFLERNLGVVKQPAAYTVLHVVPKMSPFAINSLEPQVMKRFYKDQAAVIFRPIRRFFRKLGIKATFVYKIGNPAEAISATAESEEFDLVIMGTQGAHALSRLVVGSVVSRVLAECRVPVLLVP